MAQAIANLHALEHENFTSNKLIVKTPKGILIDPSHSNAHPKQNWEKLAKEVQQPPGRNVSHPQGAASKVGPYITPKSSRGVLGRAPINH